MRTGSAPSTVALTLRGHTKATRCICLSRNSGTSSPSAMSSLRVIVIDDRCFEFSGPCFTAHLAAELERAVEQG